MKMQMRAMRTGSQIAECSFSSAKLRFYFESAKKKGEKVGAIFWLFQYFVVPLQKLCGTRQFESKLSLRSFAKVLHLSMARRKPNLLIFVG